MSHFLYNSVQPNEVTDPSLKKTLSSITYNYLSLGGLPTIGDSQAEEDPRSRVSDALDPRLHPKHKKNRS